MAAALGKECQGKGVGEVGGNERKGGKGRGGGKKRRRGGRRGGTGGIKGMVGKEKRGGG